MAIRSEHNIVLRLFCHADLSVLIQAAYLLSQGAFLYLCLLVVITGFAYCRGLEQQQQCTQPQGRRARCATHGVLEDQLWRPK
jgi:hypothetical protein